MSVEHMFFGVHLVALLTGTILFLAYLRRTYEASKSRHPEEKGEPKISVTATVSFAGGFFGTRIPFVRLALDEEYLYIVSYNPTYSLTRNRNIRIPITSIRLFEKIIALRLLDAAYRLEFETEPEHLETTKIVIFVSDQGFIGAMRAIAEGNMKGGS